MRQIDADALKKEFCKDIMGGLNWERIIDNAPTVENTINVYPSGNVIVQERSQGEYVNISKLRLMTVEECAGHTIDYAMGWKACIEWIKKGGAK